jgi:hypothetical protein
MTTTGDAAGAHGDLLYIAHEGGTPNVTILTYPHGKIVGAINNLGPTWGACSDSAGNVWIDAYGLFEYAHGGKKPIAKLPFPGSGGLGLGCSVDPTTGNLAAIELASSAVLDIWPNAQGTPTVYPAPFEPASCSYDDQGNLFIDGANPSTQALVLAELTKGGNQFQNITLNEQLHWGGGIKWDGAYVVVNTTVPSAPKGKYHVVVRVSVSGSTGTVVDTIPLRDLSQTSNFVLRGRTLIATTGAGVGLWKYPQGGRHFRVLKGFPPAWDLAMSVPPSARTKARF